MKTIVIFWLTVFLFPSLNANAQTTDTCQCTFSEKYKLKIIQLIRKYDELSNHALNNSDDRKYKRRKYHKNCGGPVSYYFREKLRETAKMIRPVFQNKQVIMVSEDWLPESIQSRYSITVRMPDNTLCVISWVQDE